MLKIVIIIMITIFALFPYDLFSCTVITKSDSQKVLVGMNVDWMIPCFEIFYTPPTGDQYGSISFGVFGIPNAGGVNDQGLFWFPATVNNIEMNAMKERSLYAGDYIFSDLMAHCATVKEAIAFLSQYDLSNDLENVHLILIDKSGDYAVLEGDEIMTRDKNFYVLENISIFKLPERHILCRYRMAYDLLEKSDLTIDAFRHILSVTCQGTRSECPTQFSAIFDLTNFTITLYHFQNFTESLIIDIKNELKQDRKIERLPELFSTKWSFLNEGRKKRISEVIYQEIKNQNTHFVIEKYKTLKKTASDQYEFDNWDLDFIGFSCMFNQRLTDALTIFELNVNEYPDYAYGYYNLGRIYYKLGDNKKAIAALQKSVKLDPTRSVTNKYLNHVLDHIQN